MAVDDKWLFVTEDGRLIRHTENDGATYLRRGAEATEAEITPAQLSPREREVRCQHCKKPLEDCVQRRCCSGCYHYAG